MPDRPAETGLDSLVTAVDCEHNAHAIAPQVNKLLLGAFPRESAVVLNCSLLIFVHAPTLPCPRNPT